MPAVNQAALIDQFPLQRRHEKKSEVRMRVPELEERIQVLRNITRSQQAGHRMRRIQVGQRHRGRL